MLRSITVDFGTEKINTKLVLSLSVSLRINFCISHIIFLKGEVHVKKGNYNLI